MKSEENIEFCTNCKEEVKTYTEEVKGHFDSIDTWVEIFCTKCNNQLGGELK